MFDTETLSLKWISVPCDYNELSVHNVIEMTNEKVRVKYVPAFDAFLWRIQFPRHSATHKWRGPLYMEIENGCILVMGKRESPLFLCSDIPWLIKHIGNKLQEEV